MGNVTKLRSIPFYELCSIPLYSILFLGFRAEINLMQLWFLITTKNRYNMITRIALKYFSLECLRNGVYTLHVIRGEGKVVPVHAMKAYRGRRSTASLLISALHGGVSCQHHAPTALPPRNDSGTHRTGGWVVPRARMDVLKKTEISLLSGFELQTVQPVA
jgi:hypothetical protein